MLWHIISWASQLIFINTAMSYSMTALFPCCSCFVFSSSLTFFFLILLFWCKDSPELYYLSFWSKVLVFFKSMILFYINFFIQALYIYFHAFHILHCFATVSFTSLLLFFKVLRFSFQLVYQNVFILDECSGLVNFPHQFHCNPNAALILKLYLFSCSSCFFNFMDHSIQGSWANIFYAVFSHILLSFN